MLSRLVLALLLRLGGVSADLFVVLLKGGKIFTRLRELTLFDRKRSAPIDVT